MKGIYFPNSSFLQAARGSHVSWIWLSLLQGRNLLTKGLRWQVQNGASIDFWEGKWIPSTSNFKINTPKPPNPVTELVSDVIDHQRGKWKVEQLEKEVSPVELETILKIPLPVFQRNDKLIWHFSNNGIYSVKSGYRLAFVPKTEECKPGSSFRPNPNLWKTIWKLKVPNKIRNFWWRVCKDSLASKENLYKRKCAPSNLCPLCHLHVESTDHILFSCSWVRAVWFGFNIDLGGVSNQPDCP